jgi:hypothetical protein
MSQTMDSDEIRRLVREALSEALDVTAGPTGDEQAVAVTIESDADLMAFAREVAGNPDAVKSGEKTYRLVRRETKPVAGATKTEEAFRWEGGVLNEIKVIELAKHHSRVLLGSGAVVTPLARDKARHVKLELVKERS